MAPEVSETFILMRVSPTIQEWVVKAPRDSMLIFGTPNRCWMPRLMVLYASMASMPA